MLCVVGADLSGIRKGGGVEEEEEADALCFAPRESFSTSSLILKKQSNKVRLYVVKTMQVKVK